LGLKKRFRRRCQIQAETIEPTRAMRILVVEDEPRLQRNLAKALREEGYAVDAAGDGDDGMFKAETYAYDAIILDVMLPKLDGWEFLARLRTKQRTPVLMLTARDAHADRIKGLDTGADDYLVKPFDLGELLARLRALIRRSASKPTNQIDLGEVALDTRAKTATRAGEPVTLTPREFAILEYLALHRGEVISRSELYEHLFDENDDTLSNLLDVHVFSIRKKLGAELITTRRGQGYCIEK
jgi:two-component system, OmpR family, response regulator